MLPREEPTVPEAAAMVERQLRTRGISDERVLAAMARVPRHRFIPATDRRDAYSDAALPTAEGQTISQPYMVARMTQALAVRPDMKVLEIGTGSGYQTALLLELGARVTSMERFPSLAEQARAVLHGLYPDAALSIHVGDGTLGWADGAPYDGVLVAAGAPHLPRAYWEQLTPDGRVVIPIGDRDEQTLRVIVRDGDDRREFQDVACRFVPLVGADGWQE